METLDSKVKNQDGVCRWIGQVKPDDDMNVETIFYRAEALRLFKCPNGDIQADIRMAA